MSLDKETAEYAAKTPRSRALHEEATAVMPGGNSRTTTFFDPYPFYFQRGQGAHIWDADGIERVDFNNNYTSLVLGHAIPDVVKAVQAVAESGLSFPGPTEHEVRLAEMIVRRVPSVESLRFTNSGTEATMNAVRLARAFTDRPKIAKFEGAFHGTHDWVMVSVTGDTKSWGNRRKPKAVAWSAGIPPAVLKNVVVLPWNDPEACEEILTAEAANLAALIVDPYLCNGGLVEPAGGFLSRLREVTERHGILMIMDEVISFRTAWGGGQERLGVRPDLTTFGKVIGGGLPVGAFGGSRAVMAELAPEGPCYQAGTLSGNPLATAAGLAVLGELAAEGVYERLEEPRVLDRADNSGNDPEARKRCLSTVCALPPGQRPKSRGRGDDHHLHLEQPLEQSDGRLGGKRRGPEEAGHRSGRRRQLHLGDLLAHCGKPRVALHRLPDAGHVRGVSLSHLHREREAAGVHRQRTHHARPRDVSRGRSAPSVID